MNWLLLKTGVTRRGMSGVETVVRKVLAIAALLFSVGLALEVHGLNETSSYLFKSAILAFVAVFIFSFGASTQADDDNQIRQRKARPPD